MLNINTATLRRALGLQEKIEKLQRELASLMGGSAAPAAEILSPVFSAGPRRRGRKPGRPPKSGRRVSPLKGKKRPSSPSGPLGPAVIKVMKRAGGPLNVDAVLKGLQDDKYVWNVAEPKKNLAARIYKLPGVKKVGPGLFDLIGRKKK